MEYAVIGAIALIVFIALIVIIKVDKFRIQAGAMFLQAEKYLDDKEKFNYVCSNLYNYLPTIITMFINPELFETIMQKVYDNTRQVANDILDDGKLNKSNKEE